LLHPFFCATPFCPLFSSRSCKSRSRGFRLLRPKNFRCLPRFSIIPFEELFCRPPPTSVTPQLERQFRFPPPPSDFFISFCQFPQAIRFSREPFPSSPFSSETAPSSCFHITDDEYPVSFGSRASITIRRRLAPRLPSGKALDFCLEPFLSDFSFPR